MHPSIQKYRSKKKCAAEVVAHTATAGVEAHAARVSPMVSATGVVAHRRSVGVAEVAAVARSVVRAAMFVSRCWRCSASSRDTDTS